MPAKFTKVEKIILVFIGTLLNFSALSDPDFGWHFKYGEWFVKHGQILRDNIFSYTMPDYKWANSYWVSEVFFYLVVTYLGAFFLSLVLSLILSALQVLIVDKLNGSKVIKAVFLITFWTTLSESFITVRPLFFSTIFLLILTYALLYKREFIKFFPILFLLWVNMHADFMLGLFIFGVYCFFEIINILKQQNEGGGEKKLRAISLILFPFILSILATLINPFGIKLWETLLAEIFNTTQVSQIIEWRGFFKLDKISVYNITTLIPNAVLLSFLTIPLIAYRKKYGLWYLLVNITFLVLTIRSTYFLRVFYITAMAGNIEFWSTVQEKLAEFLTNFKPKLTKNIKRTAVIFILIVSLAGFAQKAVYALNFDKVSQRKFCPKETLDFIRTNNLQGNMFNTFDFGGFLIWQLPEYKTFIDGRMNSWKNTDGHLFEDYMKISRKPEENYDMFLSLVDKHGIGWVLFNKEAELVKFLETRTAEWKNVHTSGRCRIFIRNNSL